MTREIRVGIIQMDVELGNIAANLGRALRMIEEAAEQGAQVVCLPELFATGYNMEILGERFVELAQPADGPVARALGQVSQKRGLYIIAGMAESQQMPGVVYNSALLLGPDGQVKGTYRKTHAFGLERFYFRNGGEYPVFQTELGRFGLLICYDAGFPEAGRALALAGVEVIFIPSAWEIRDKDLWDVNTAARALDNLVFVVAANRVGMEGTLHLFGNSKVVDPRGHVLAEAAMDREEVLVTTIDLDDIVKWRKEVRYMTDRRPELYSILCKPL
ncbi:MAG: carbon-nitrogen hydrolase [Chloroflexi bacterium]|nr:carbon-nitrogen hydrolase [Chloroflexota bacterium]